MDRPETSATGSHQPTVPVTGGSPEEAETPGRLLDEEDPGSLLDSIERQWQENEGALEPADGPAPPAGSDEEPDWEEILRKLRSVATRRLGLSADEAEELAQQSIWKVLRWRARSGDVLRNPTAFCIGALFNEFRMWLRKRRPETVEAELLDLRTVPAADAEASRADDLERVASALTRLQLSERDRTALHRRYWEGRKLAEIAAELGVSVGTLKRRLYEIRRDLAGLLGAREGAFGVGNA